MPTVLIHPSLPNENEIKFEVNKDHILFDELERQGHSLPHGCLSGSCGSCRLEILEGAQNLSKMGPVEADTVQMIQKNYSADMTIRLSCRAKVLGDIKIRIIK